MNLHEAIKTGNLKFRDYINKAVETGKFNESMFVIDISALDTYEADKISDFFDRTEVTGRMKEIIMVMIHILEHIVYLSFSVMAATAAIKK